MSDWPTSPPWFSPSSVDSTNSLRDLYKSDGSARVCSSETSGSGRVGGMEMAYFCIGEGSFVFGGVAAVVNGREVDERPRSVKGRQDSSACSLGSFWN